MVNATTSPMFSFLVQMAHFIQRMSSCRLVRFQSQSLSEIRWNQCAIGHRSEGQYCMRQVIKALEKRISALEVGQTSQCYVAVRNQDGTLRPRNPGQVLAPRFAELPDVMTVEDWKATYCRLPS